MLDHRLIRLTSDDHRIGELPSDSLIPSMKRGFLLKAQAKRRGAQNKTEHFAASTSAYKPFSLPQNSKGEH